MERPSNETTGYRLNIYVMATYECPRVWCRAIQVVTSADPFQQLRCRRCQQWMNIVQLQVNNLSTEVGALTYPNMKLFNIFFSCSHIMRSLKWLEIRHQITLLREKFKKAIVC